VAVTVGASFPTQRCTNASRSIEVPQGEYFGQGSTWRAEVALLRGGLAADRRRPPAPRLRRGRNSVRAVQRARLSVLRRQRGPVPPEGRPLRGRAPGADGPSNPAD